MALYATAPACVMTFAMAAGKLRAVQKTIDDIQDVLATVTTAVTVAAKFASVVA